MRILKLTILLALISNNTFTQEQSPTKNPFPIFSSDGPTLLDIDLKTRPNRIKRNDLKANIVVSYIQALNTAALKYKYLKNLYSIQYKLKSELPDNSGMLVMIEIYEDELGNVFANNNIVYPLQTGIFPVDAAANYINHPVMVPPPITGAALINNTYYLWLYKKDGNLKIGVIPKDFKKELWRQANKLAIEKTRISSFYYTPIYQPISINDNARIPDEIQKARYWSERYERFKNEFEDQSKAMEVKRLTAEMEVLQSNFNKLASEARHNLEKIQSNNALLATLGIFVSLGNTVNDFYSEGNATTDTRLVEKESITLIERNTIISKDLEAGRKEIINTDMSIKSLYRESNIKLPPDK